MSDKLMFARILNLDYLNSFDQNQLDLSENDVTKNINNLTVSMENNKVHLKWTDCVNSAWKKSYVVRAENAIPTSVYNGDIVTSYTEKNKYSNIEFVDDNISDNVLYCYRVFSEFSNDSKYYSGFKNIFYVYVASVTMCDQDHQGGPVLAANVITDPLNRFVSDTKIEEWNNKSEFDGDYTKLNNKPDLSAIALSGDYTDLINKPNVYIKSEVYNKEEVNQLISNLEPGVGGSSFSGDYNDLTNKPDVYTKAEVYNKTEAYNKTEVDSLVQTNSFSGSYNDLTERPTFSQVATSGSYTDLTNKPSVYQKPEVYNRGEVDSLIDGVKSLIPEGGSPGEGSTVQRYVPQGANNGDCYVVATKPGVTFSKEGNYATLTVPSGVELLSVQVRFAGSEIAATGKCTIKYGDSYNFDNNLCIPTFNVINDLSPNRAYKMGQPATIGNHPNEIEFTNMNANQGVVIKLSF